MSVSELLASMSASELAEWMAYEEITGPLGPERGDIHAGIIASTIANVNRKKGKRPYKPQEFMPTWDRPRANTPQQMANFLKSLTLGLGGKIRKRED